MNKNYIFGLIAIVVVIVLVMVFFSPIITSMALQQIILTKDCDGIDKWSKTVASEFDLLFISESQANDAMVFSDECLWKIVADSFANAPIKPIEVLDEILAKRDCEGIDEWGSDHIVNNKDVTLNSKQVLDIRELIIECNSSEVDNFLRESDLSTDTTDPMVVLGKILNKKDCEGMEAWSNEYRESHFYKDMMITIKFAVWDFERACRN